MQVIEVNGKVVRLGIDAPKEIPVHRSELYERIRENERTLAAPRRSWIKGAEASCMMR